MKLISVRSSNGANQTIMILQPEDEYDKLLLKELGDGSTISIIGSGNSILQNSVEGSLMITKTPKK